MSSRRKTTLPESLAGSVARELERLGGPKAGSAGELVSVWPSAVGPAIARNAWPARYRRDGTLVVHTSSSAWAFELTQLEATLRERLGPLAPPRLAFVVGPVPESNETEPEASSSRPPVGRREQALGAEIARPIEDPELRELVARAAAASLARAVATDPSDTL